MQFLSGLGRYFETPQAYEDGERFDITGVDNNYQAPVAGLGARVLGLTHEHPHHHRYARGYTHFGAHDRAPSQKRVSNVSSLRGRVKGGMGRYFETPAAYAAGERFEMVGAEGDYQAPVEGVGRYFEDAYGIEHGERFDIAGANTNYQAPLVGGVGRYMLDDTAFKGVGAIPQTTVAQLQREGVLGVSGYRETLESANPYLLIGAGVALGALITYAAHRMKK
jgi:hypothetical protein